MLGAYFLMNIGYSYGLKDISILDMLILATGFVLRVKGGAMIIKVDSSDWLIIMTFLLALFMAIAKRRDDLLLQQASGTEMRKSMSGYNQPFLDTMLGLFGAIIIVAYISYTVSPRTVARLGTYRMYYSSLFVIAGIMRYLQVVFVQKVIRLANGYFIFRSFYTNHHCFMGAQYLCVVIPATSSNF